MPWKAFKIDNQWCVFRINAQGKRFGRRLGCHMSKDEANDQVAALSISEDKAIYESTSEDGNHSIKWLPSSVVSFAAFDAMKEAEKQAIAVKNDAEVFKAIVDNILEMPMDDERPFDRSEMIMAAAAEFAVRTSPNENKEENLTKEQLHYKEVLEDDAKVKSEDFQGGCSFCGFGEVELIKDLDKCPYCWEVVK